jgi:hypothetical protein
VRDGDAAAAGAEQSAADGKPRRRPQRSPARRKASPATGKRPARAAELTAADGEASQAAAGLPATSAELPPAVAELLPGFVAENELERRVLEDPDLLAGLAWGEPREGHPEGAVAHHVADLLATLDGWGESPERRAKLRFIALVHDSFKADVRERLPKIGRNHHADRARRFAEDFISDPAVLTTIQHHDRPYAIWRKLKRKDKLDERTFNSMMDDIVDPDLFIRFVELDGSTAGKNREPIQWFRAELEKRGYELPQPPRP